MQQEGREPVSALEKDLTGRWTLTRMQRTHMSSLPVSGEAGARADDNMLPENFPLF